jgi:hypothetical protein
MDNLDGELELAASLKAFNILAAPPAPSPKPIILGGP